MIDSKTLKKYMNALSDGDKEILIRKIKKMYEKRYKVCRSCNIGISKNEKYVKDEYGHIHIVCKYKELKEEIKDEQVEIENVNREIANLLLDIKEHEKEIGKVKKNIGKIQQKMNHLGQKYSDEIVKEAL